MTFYRSLMSSFLLLRSIQAQSGDGVSSASTAPACPNALTNPSFSDGMEDWTWGTTPDEGGTYTFVSTDSVEGTSYLQLSGNWLTGLSFYQTLDDLDDNTVYTASVDWRLQSSYSDGFECILTLDSGDNENAFSNTISTPSDDWSLLEGSVLVSTSLSFVVTIDCSQSSRSFMELYVDVNNVELVPAACSSSSSSSSSSAAASSTSTSASSSSSVTLSTASSSSSAVILSTTPRSSSAVVSSTSSSSSTITPSSSPIRIPPSVSSQSTSAVTPSSSIGGSELSSSRPCRSRRPSTTTSSLLQQSSASEPTRTVSIPTSITSGSTGLTTSTILSTRTETITACPSTVTDCPAIERTTYVTTETIVISTTICPVTAQGQSTKTAASVSAEAGISPGSGSGSPLSISTTPAISFAISTATAIESEQPITTSISISPAAPSVTTPSSPFGAYSNRTASQTPSSGVLLSTSYLSSVTTSSASTRTSSSSAATSAIYTGKATRSGISLVHLWVAFCIATMVRLCV